VDGDRPHLYASLCLQPLQASRFPSGYPLGLRIGCAAQSGRVIHHIFPGSRFHVCLARVRRHGSAYKLRERQQPHALRSVVIVHQAVNARLCGKSGYGPNRGICMGMRRMTPPHACRDQITDRTWMRPLAVSSLFTTFAAFTRLCAPPLQWRGIAGHISIIGESVE
jgi:hypothetical protein